MAAEPAAGRASAEGTSRYASRFPRAGDHFRQPDTLHFSSLALGMRNGEPGGLDDVRYRSAVHECLARGVNVFVSGLAERMQTSERCLGVALGRAFRQELAARDEVIVVTRGGYLAVDPDLVRTRAEARRYLNETYVDSGLVDPDHVAFGVHCLDPGFLRDQIRRSRANLRLETIDFYLLEEPELLLRHAGPDGFCRGMRAAFEALEAAAAEGEIGAYGIATWDGLLRPRSDRFHVALLELFDWALEVGGAAHHLRALALPYGLALADARREPTQWVAPGETEAVLEALRGTGTAVLASAPLAQGRALSRLPRFVAEALPGLRSDAQRCLQFARSTPGITSAVVGMREQGHVEENLELSGLAPAPAQAIEGLLQRADRAA